MEWNNMDNDNTKWDLLRSSCEKRKGRRMKDDQDEPKPRRIHADLQGTSMKCPHCKQSVWLVPQEHWLPETECPACGGTLDLREPASRYDLALDLEGRVVEMRPDGDGQ